MDKISIIIPVYNGAAKLRRCVESVLNQTYSMIEIIIVDDGSNDGSDIICDKLKEKYHNIKVIHKDNGGVSSARNTGLKYATGKYIGFVDCDDFIEGNMYQTMIEEIMDSDLIMCGFYKDGVKSYVEIPCRCIISKEDAIWNIIGRGQFKGYLWNKLFKKSIIIDNKITFNTNIHMCEDLLFCAQYINKIKKACLIPEALYHYENDGKNSASRGEFTIKKMSVIDAYNNLLVVDIIKENNEIYKEIEYKKIVHCLSLWNGIWKSNFTNKKEFLTKVKKEIENESWDFLRAKKYSIKHKIIFVLIKLI